MASLLKRLNAVVQPIDKLLDIAHTDMVINILFKSMFSDIQEGV